MSEKPSFYAIIPANVRYDSRLPANAKLLYGELTALTSKEGFCWASNGYFAELYQLSSRTIRRYITTLQKCGYIYVEIENEYERKIYISTPSPQDKSVPGVGQKCPGGRTRVSRGVGQKCPHISTESNTKSNTSNKGETAQPDGDAKDINEVIDSFEQVNPANRTWFANKTQRSAVKRLLERYDKALILQVLETLPSSNKQPYFPIINTPLQLEQKWTQLEAATQRAQQENKSTVIW